MERKDIMEWLSCIKSAIDYMENNLLTVKGPEDVAGYLNVSTLYLQKGFQIITGYNIGEYIRNRRRLRSLDFRGSFCLTLPMRKFRNFGMKCPKNTERTCW